MKFWPRVRDKYLTWRTGKTQDQRDREAWLDQNINHRAQTVREYYCNFPHIIEVNPDRFLIFHLFVEPCPEAAQYLWPHKPLGEHAEWGIHRVIDDDDYTFNGLGDCDIVIVATHDPMIAAEVSLKFS